MFAKIGLASAKYDIAQLCQPSKLHIEFGQERGFDMGLDYWMSYTESAFGQVLYYRTTDLAMLDIDNHDLDPQEAARLIKDTTKFNAVSVSKTMNGYHIFYPFEATPDAWLEYIELSAMLKNDPKYLAFVMAHHAFTIRMTQKQEWGDNLSEGLKTPKFVRQLITQSGSFKSCQGSIDEVMKATLQASINLG